MERLANLIFINNGEVVKKIALLSAQRAKLLIGRDANCDVQFTSNFVGRQHAEIIFDGNKIYVRDLRSTNGVFINGRKVGPGETEPLKLGDVVTFFKESTIQLMIAVPDNHSSPASSEKVSNSNLFHTSISNELSKKSKIVIGRGRGCDIVINQATVSSEHAYIEKLDDGTFLIRDTSTNGTYVNDRLVSGRMKISSQDIIKIAGFTFKIGDSVDSYEKGKVKIGSLSEKLKNKNSIIIGRGNDADLVLNNVQVSRHHAEVTREGDAYFVRDLGSSNGTYLNGKLIKGKVRITDKDTLYVGLYAFNLNKETENLEDQSVAIRAVNIEKSFGEKLVLKRMNVEIPHKAFVALMGPSGCGKTTLMNVLNGDNPATKGIVYIHGLELNSNYSLLKRKIGYVPQQDIVHGELTIDDTLYFAAKLRMPDDTPESNIRERIDQVLTNLKINTPEIRQNKVSKLSGGQRKRISIAVELLNNPKILFLDEPTSPLDPETIEEFLNCIKSLTETEGTTVVMVTHKPDDLQYVDKVIFMASKGYNCFYGEKDNIVSYFHAENLINVYTILSKDENSIKQWYNKHNQKQEDTATKEQPDLIKKDRDESLLRQTYWLVKRYLSIKLSDKLNLGLLMAQPLIISILLILLFDKIQLGVLFLMAISSVWFGVSNAAKEIACEVPIYRRERMFNLNILTYIGSKLIVLSALALIQVLLFVSIVKFKYSGNEINLVNFWQYVWYMFYLAFSATLMGLFLSAWFSEENGTSTEKVMTIVPIALMPQIMLAGVVTRIDVWWKELLSYLTLGRWGTEGFARIQDDKIYQMVDTLLVDRKVDTLFKYVHPIPGRPDSMKVFDKLDITYKHVSHEVFKSLYNSVPSVSDDTLVMRINNNKITDTVAHTFTQLIPTKASALDQLGFYDKVLKDQDKLLCWFDSLSANFMIMTALNLVIFMGIFYALKKKDRI